MALRATQHGSDVDETTREAEKRNHQATDGCGSYRTNYHSFASYDGLVALLAQTGAFHDCPQWNEVGSFDSEGASYTTNW